MYFALVSSCFFFFSSIFTWILHAYFLKYSLKNISHGHMTANTYPVKLIPYVLCVAQGNILRIHTLFITEAQHESGNTSSHY